jgi:sugar lactone lactonase YvrE
VSAVNSAGEGTPSSPSNAIQFIPQKLLPSVDILAPGEICTIAGNGKKGDSGDGGMAVNARLNEPYDVAVDEQGNIYIADSGNNKIRRISVDTGIIETEVGTGTSGFSGDGGPAVNAQLDRPRGIDFDSLGNLYIADRGNNRVRKVNFRSHEIETIAGNGSSGNDGDGLSAQLAQLADPESVSVDHTTGRIYITGIHGMTSNIRKRVRVVDETGTIHTFAGSEGGPNPQDGVSATNVTFSTVDDLVIAVDSAGHVFIGEITGKRLYTVSCETGSISTIAGDGSSSTFGGDGPAIGISIEPQGLASYGEGSTVFINDGGSVFMGFKRIRKLDVKSGIITTVAGYGKKGFEGDGGPAISAKFDKPRGLAVDSYGNLYIADTDNNRVRVIRKP